MARGWESKSVESQMETAKENHPAGAKPPVTDEERTRQREREGLKLSRAYVLHQIESSGNARYIESLRKALSEIEQKLAELGQHR